MLENHDNNELNHNDSVVFLIVAGLTGDGDAETALLLSDSSSNAIQSSRRNSRLLGSRY